jgi:hypothetical protein
MQKATRVDVRRIQRSAAGIAVVLGALLIPIGPAHAQATVTRFFGTHTESFTAPLEGCLPEDLVGTVTVTETSAGQEVLTGTDVYVIHGVNVYDFHLDLPGGVYVQSWRDLDQYTLVLNPPLTVYNVVTQDLRTIYAADGSPIGTLSIHAGYHVTYDDLDGNGTPDPGEITAGFDHFHLRCG